MLGINPAKMAKEELLKVDLDHNKVPDVFQALDGAEAGLDGLAGFLDGITPYEAENMLRALNMLRVSENRKSDAEIKEIAAKVVLIGPGLKAAKAALEKVEAELKKG